MFIFKYSIYIYTGAKVLKNITPLYETLYLLTSEKCPRCLSAKMILEEISYKLGINLNIENIDNVNEDVNFNMLENQIFLTSTPSLIGERDGNMNVIDISINLSTEHLMKMITGQ